jgi:hypothetical protein
MRARASARATPRGINGDPAAAPLLGDVGGGAGTARRVQHEVAGIGGHEEASLDSTRSCLNDIEFLVSKPTLPRVIPDVIARFESEIGKIPNEGKGVANAVKPIGFIELLQPSEIRAEGALSGAVGLALEGVFTDIICLWRPGACKRIVTVGAALCWERGCFICLLLRHRPPQASCFFDEADVHVLRVRSAFKGGPELQLRSVFGKPE